MQNEMRRLIHLVEDDDDLWRQAMRVALETMRVLSDQNGSFTRNELATEIGNHLDIRGRRAARIADHMLDRFGNMLTKQGDGYRLLAAPGSMRPQMDLLRSLANRS